MFCEQCGTQIPDNTKFCPSCGARTDGSLDAQNVQQGAQVQPGMQGSPAGMPQGPYPQMAPGPQGRPQMHPKKKGVPGIVIVLIILVLVIGGIVAAVFVVKNKIKGKLDELGVTGILEDVGNMANGMTGNYDSRIKIPEGATPVMDANLMTLVGTYEGQFQCTALEGMENIPGAPADQVKQKVDEALAAPVKCTLEIRDDGDWELECELLGSMDMRGRDFRIEDPQIPAEESAHLIQMVNGGCYTINVNQKEEVNSKELGNGEATGKMVHTGVYCEKDGKNLITGFISVSMTMNKIDIKLEGEFTVDKTTGDYVPEGGEEVKEIMDSYKEKGSGEDGDGGNVSGSENDKAKNEDEGSNGDRDDSNGNNDGDRDSERDSDDSGKTSAGGDPSQTAEKGGEWDILQSGEFQYYDKNGKLLTCAWAEDEGGYYYLGPDGCLVYNNYSHDGYWVDKNGCWDSSKPKVDMQFEPLNNTYVGSLWTLDVYMNGSSSGTAKWWYTNNFGGGEPKKYDFTIKQLGPSSYAAYSDINENEIYLISVVDDGWTLILSCDGSTDTLKIQ